MQAFHPRLHSSVPPHFLHTINAITQSHVPLLKPSPTYPALSLTPHGSTTYVLFLLPSQLQERWSRRKSTVSEPPADWQVLIKHAQLGPGFPNSSAALKSLRNIGSIPRSGSAQSSSGLLGLLRHHSSADPNTWPRRESPSSVSGSSSMVLGTCFLSLPPKTHSLGGHFQVGHPFFLCSSTVSHCSRNGLEGSA